MNWQAVVNILEFTSHLLLLLSYGTVAALFLYCYLKGQPQKLGGLFWLSFWIVVGTVSLHLEGHLLGLFYREQIPLLWAIAVNLGVVGLLMGLVIRLLPLIRHLIDRGSPQSLEQIRKNLQRTEYEYQITNFALQDSEDRFRSIFDHAPIGIALLDRQGKILETNYAYQEMLGEKKPHIDQSQPLLCQSTHPEDIDQDRQAIAKLFGEGLPSYAYTKRYLINPTPPDGQGDILWVNIRLSLVQSDSPGTEPYAIAMLENITDQQRTEAELRQTQARLQELLQARTDQILQMNEELSWQASHDPLTGLLNRFAFERHLTKTLTDQKRNARLTEHTLCYINLDRFKAINELGGTMAGDEILKQVSRIIENRCRQTDSIARLNADEFALLLHQCSLEQAEKVALSIVEKIQMARFRWQNSEYTLSASIGLVPINESSGDGAEMMIAADAACYAAKRRGRSRIHVYEANDQELVQYRSEAEWVRRIEQALVSDHFRLFMQPIVALDPADEVEHGEILIRMVTDNGDVISPGLFLPAAERYHLMTKIDYWVIEHTLRELSQGGSRNHHCVYSINLSGESLNNDSLLTFLQGQFERYPVPTHQICFEVTETVAIANLQRANDVLQSIRGMGCQIALDDFGTGMSSFSYLKYLPIDYLKIDGSFIKDIVDDPIDYAMVDTMNRIGHVMGMKTVAEYVANEAILAKIKELGIDYGQGFGIAAPTPLMKELVK